jgi:hypothetical protein
LSTARKLYSVLGVILLVELGLQFFLIAGAALSVWGANDNASSVYAAFKTGDKLASIHALDGTFVIPFTILLLIAAAFMARLPGRQKGRTAGLFGLMIIQFILGVIGSGGGLGLAIIGGLHGLNALAIVGLAITLVRQTWAFGSVPGAATSPAVAEATP